MASTVNIRLDHKGIGEILRSAEVALAVVVKAAEVAAIAEAHHSIRKHDMPIKTRFYISDRAAVGVAIAHPGGLNVEAKYGVLAHAAAAVGLDVTAHEEAILRRTKRATTEKRKARRDASTAALSAEEARQQAADKRKAAKARRAAKAAA